MRSDIVRQDCLPLDHAMDPDFAAPMQCADPVANRRIRLRSPLVVADIFDPGGRVLGFGPDFRFLEIAHQRPLPRAVADPHTPPV